VAKIEVELIFPGDSRQFSDLRDVDVELAVPIYICHRDASRPAAVTSDSGRFGDVFKLEISLVKVEPIRDLIAGEIKVHQSVTVDVAGRNAAAVVEVEVIEDVDFRCGRELILESNSCLL